MISEGLLESAANSFMSMLRPKAAANRKVRQARVVAELHC